MTRRRTTEKFLAKAKAKHGDRYDHSEEASMEVDEEKIDDAVLALLYLTLHEESRAWKGMDFEVMNRLHQKGYIDDPVNKNKSVWLTKDGRARSEVLFEKLFVK